jgi:hypothetical protein
MAHGIQYFQATQFFELPSSSARGVPELRNKKCLNPNLTCGTRIWGQIIAEADPLKSKWYIFLFSAKKIFS